MKHENFDLKARNTVDIIVLLIISLIPFVVLQVDPNYHQYLPKIEVNIFEQLSQINAIILGLTLVGIFYYLGKLDDRKRDYVIGFPTLVNYFIEFAVESDNYFDMGLDLLLK